MAEGEESGSNKAKGDMGLDTRWEGDERCVNGVHDRPEDKSIQARESVLILE